MTTIEVREEILKAWNFTIDNVMQDPVIRLYVSGEDDVSGLMKDIFIFLLAVSGMEN